MFSLNHGDTGPLYKQIKDRFRELILTGVMAEGDKIPSVREMAANLAINPNTIQKAYRELEQEGYIISVPAKGSFVAAVKSKDNLPLIGQLRLELQKLVRELKSYGLEKEQILTEIENIYKEEERL